LNLHRDGAVALAEAARRDPCLAAFGAAGLTRAMTWMADAAGLRVDGLRGRAVVRALTAVYALTIRDWVADDSPDMAQVMAGLDSRLRRLERAPGGLLAARA
ncbi:MAG: TetR family transcriptional regulator, partial [Pseudomonadota bacterium]